MLPGWLNKTLIARLAIFWLLLCAPALSACQQELKQLHFDASNSSFCGHVQADDLACNDSLFVRVSGKQFSTYGRDHESFDLQLPTWNSAFIARHVSLKSRLCNRRAFINTTLSLFARRDCTGVLVA